MINSGCIFCGTAVNDRQVNNSTRRRHGHRHDSAAVCKDTHCVVGVEDVGGRGVVHDDDLVEVATQATQVLDVITSVEDAGLPEQAAAEGAPLVQEVGDGVCILRRQRKN